MDVKTRITRRITLRYAFVLGCIAALGIVSYLMLNELAARQEDSAAVINIAGRQRMLSQQIPLLARRMVESPYPEERRELKEELTEAIDLMERSHEALIAGNPAFGVHSAPSPAVRRMYFEQPMMVNHYIRTFLEQARTVVRATDPMRRLHHLRLMESHLRTDWDLLENLDRIVEQYQKESEWTVTKLKRGAQVVLALMLLFLAWSAVGVFAPLVRQVRREMREQDQAQRRLRGILDSALDAVITIDGAGRVVEFSPSAQQMFGYRDRNVVGEDVADLIIPPHLRDGHREGLRRFAERGQGERLIGRRVEMTAMHADGQQFPVEIAVTPVVLADQTLFTAFVRDISDRKAIEEAQRKLSSAVDQSPVSIMITDLHGRIEYVNPKFEQVSGYRAREVTGHNPSILKSGETTDADYAELWRTIAAGGEWRGEFHNKRKDGSLFWEAATISPIKDNDGRITHFIAVKEDITERKQAEAALREAKEQAELANRTKTEFLANMSHELRTPLNSIIGFSDIMTGQVFGPLGEDYLEYARDINDSGRHLLSLINDILDVSRIESHALPLEERRMDLAATIGSCLNLVQERATAAGVRLEREIAEPLPALYGDQRRVKQVLLNLLANAVKFTPEGGEVRIRAGLDDLGGLSVSVRDTGIGMAPEEISTALSMFGQADASLARRYEGAGLGLPLSKRLVEMHDGTLELVSRPGKGTTVTVHFPPERTVGGDAAA